MSRPYNLWMKNVFSKKIVSTCVFAVTFIFSLTLNSAITQAANYTECIKPKKSKSVKGVKYRCVNDGEKLVWADKKTRKKIAAKIKTQIEEKKKEQTSIEKVDKSEVVPPKNFLPESREFKFSNYSE